MNLSGFQLDAINDLEMLRSLACDQMLDEHHHHPHDQQSPQQQHHHHQNRAGAQRTTSNDLHNFSENIDTLLHSSGGTNANGDDLNSFINALQQSTSSVINAQRKLSMMASAHTSSSPSSHSAYKAAAAVLTPHQTSHTVYFEEDMLTPLISPAMTPSFSYQQQQQQPPSARTSRQPPATSLAAATDYDFSPLSSPAIMPQYDQQNRSRHLSTESTFSFTEQHVQQLTHDDPFENLTPSQICEKYEQLERAKLMITHRLSELQRQQEMSGNATRTADSRRQQMNMHLNNNAHGYVSSPLAGPSQQCNAYTLQDSSHHHRDLPKHVAIPVSPVQSPQLEPVTPASLMKIKSSRSQETIGEGGTENKRKTSEEKSATTSETTTPNASTANKRGSLRSSSSSNNNSNNKHSPASKTNGREPPVKKMRRESQDIKSSANGMHASPRALKPLLISPTIRPGPGFPIPHHSLDDAERILATKSNYQNLMEGKAAALGIAFSPSIKSGLEIRRTAHKAAEQKRRDSLKEWFDRLRREVEEGYVKKQKNVVQEDEEQQQQHSTNSNPNEPARSISSSSSSSNSSSSSSGDKNKAVDEEGGASASSGTTSIGTVKPLSKVLLLKYAYEYISVLKEMVNEKDRRIQELEAAQQQNNLSQTNKED